MTIQQIGIEALLEMTSYERTLLTILIMIVFVFIVLMITGNSSYAILPIASISLLSILTHLFPIYGEGITLMPLWLSIILLIFVPVRLYYARGK